MNKAQVKPYIESLLRKDKLIKALEAMADYSAGYDDDEFSDLILALIARYNNLKREKDMGMISYGDANIRMNQLRHSILGILGELPDVGNAIDIPGAKPRVVRSGNEKTEEKIRSKEENKTLKVLFLSSNPSEFGQTGQLELGNEFRKIKDVIQLSKNRDLVELDGEPAVTIGTIISAMHDKQPDIVHFSGHGDNSIFVVNDQDGYSNLSQNGLVRLFRQYGKKLKCLVLNACYTNAIAKKISELGIYVVGMNQKVKDLASITFSKGFYQGLTHDKGIPHAFETGMIHLSGHETLSDQNTPELWHEGKQVTF